MKAVFPLLAWLIGTLANFYFILRWFSDDRFLLVRLCNYLLPWLGVLVAINIVLSALNKRWVLSVLNIPPLAVMAAIYAPLFLNCACDPPPVARTLKVMSYNIHQFNRDMPAAAALIKRESPDILLLQEIEPRYFQVVKRLLINLYDNELLQGAYNPDIMQAVLSRYPLVEKEASDFKNRLQKVVVDTPHGPVTVLNIHSYKFSWEDRHRRMENMITEDVVPATGPLILGGDFNTNDQSQTYHMIKRYLHEAHWEVGCGFGFSFPTQSFFLTKGFPIPAMIRIDHIFHSNHFTPVRAYTLDDSGGSDHYPVVAELRFPH